jgi:hypothetical protein
MKEALDLVLPALAGAALALCVLLLLRPWRRSPARGSEEVREQAWMRQAEGIEKGLRVLAEEVESQLDQKIDRLDVLLDQIRMVLREAGGGLDAKFDGDAPPGPESHGERARVLALAAGGKPADAIAEEVGLRRGEVDLILRLHRSSERPRK